MTNSRSTKVQLIPDYIFFALVQSTNKKFLSLHTYLFSINLSGAIYWLNNVLLLFWTTIGGKICSKTNQPLQIINFAKETFASVFKSKKEQEKQKQRERREQLTKSAPVNLNWQLMSKKILNRKICY